MHIGKLELTFEYSPLGIEKYYCLGGNRVCSIFEKNGQGWFLRTNGGNQIGSLYGSEQVSEDKAIGYLWSLAK